MMFLDKNGVGFIYIFESIHFSGILTPSMNVFVQIKFIFILIRRTGLEFSKPKLKNNSRKTPKESLSIIQLFIVFQNIGNNFFNSLGALSGILFALIELAPLEANMNPLSL